MNSRKNYYLQQMGIEVWQLRKVIKLLKKILVLIMERDGYSQHSVAHSKFIANIFASVSINRDDFELIYINSTTNLANIDFSLYKALVIMGESSQFDEVVLRKNVQILPPQIKVLHPDYLLTNPQKKRNVYLALRQLELNYV